MGNYQEFMTKSECLAGALLQSLILALQAGALLFAFSQLSWGNRGLFVLLILLQLAGCAFHWRRYLIYGKREGSKP